MIYVWNEQDAKARGVQPEDRYAQIFDANGLEWRSVCWCDTQTGELEFMPRDANGRYQFDADGVVTQIVKTAAPLRVVFQPVAMATHTACEES